jgi:iron complex transport system ATP-binding protein
MTAEGLWVERVSVRVGQAQLIDGLTLSAPAGRLTALVGPNGAGKSSILRVVAGAIRPDSGRVLFDGTDLVAVAPRTRARQVALLEQQNNTEQDVSARDVVALGRIPHLTAWKGPGALDQALIDDALAQVDASHLAERAYRSLSGGEQQRVRLAAALAQQPRLLLVDEPTNHLDIGAQLDALALLRRLADTGITVVTALHDLGHALTFADHVVAMSTGRAVAQGVPNEVLGPELIHQLYGVRADVLVHPVTGAPLLAYRRDDLDLDRLGFARSTEGPGMAHARLSGAPARALAHHTH